VPEDRTRYPLNVRRVLGRLVALHAALLAVGVSASCTLSDHERRALGAWMGCTECSQGQLDSLLALNRTVYRRPVLHAALRHALLGPVDTVALARLRRQLEAQYAADSADAVSAGDPPITRPTRREWAERHIRNRLWMRQLRAAVALQRIGDGGSLPDSVTLRRAGVDAGVVVAVERLRAARVP